MNADLIATIATYVTAAVTAASFIVKGVAVITHITPSTRDDEIVTGIQKGLARVQKLLGMLALDSGKQARQTPR